MRETARCSSWRPARWTDNEGNLCLLITTIDLQQAQFAASKFPVHSPTGSSWNTWQRPRRLQAGRFGGRTPVEARDFLFSPPVQTGLGAHPDYSGRSVAWHSPPTPSSTEVKKKWSFSSTPPLSAWPFFTFRTEVKFQQRICINFL